MNRYCPKGFYVYLHIRKSDGLVFYVGKGKNYRAWDLSNTARQNTYWQRTRDKHGIVVLVLKENMPELCALTLEKITIAKYKKLGHPITNRTDGGEGFDTVDNEFRIERMISVVGRSVVSSLNEYFDTVSSASRWLRENGYPNASAAAVSAVARGERSFSYQRGWAFGNLAPEHPEIVDAIDYARSVIAKPVVRSDGVTYESAHYAARVMSLSSHPKACSSSIRKACIGVLKTAYGYKWKYENE